MYLGYQPHRCHDDNTLHKHRRIGRSFFFLGFRLSHSTLALPNNYGNSNGYLPTSPVVCGTFGDAAGTVVVTVSR
jgi:hypothetical protein